MNSGDLFPTLCTHFNASPGKKNEAHVDCPFCGSKAGNQVNPHASFSPKGFKCFSCGTGKSLKALWEHIGHPEYKTPDVPIKPLPEAKKTPFKLSLDQYKRDYLTSDVIGHWQNYKPLPDMAIKAYQLGYGILPRSSCKHNRLIVPVFGRDGQIVHLRGRRIDCQCESKWTVSGGWSMESLEPYNSQCVKPIVLIVENPIDALMISSGSFYVPIIRLILPLLVRDSIWQVDSWVKNWARYDYPISAIATFSVAYWREDWSDYLKDASQIIVAYDNDLPGNGGSVNRDRFIADWRRDIPDRPIPKASGVTLVNRLRHEGLPATLLDWGNRPAKFDIGSLLTEQR